MANMKVRSILAVSAAIMVGGTTFASPALATNGHQDHQGACARSTTSINKGVGDLQFNGVLGSFADSFGIHGVDGAIQKRMNSQLVVGEVVTATVTDNEGCDGAGNTFGAGKRTLRKDEQVVVRSPARFGSSVCQHRSKQCRAVTITVKVALPASCWNRNKGTIKVRIWIKKSHHGKKPTKKVRPKKPCNCESTPPAQTPSTNCSGNTTNNGNNEGLGGNAQGGNCSTNVNCTANGSPGAVVCSPVIIPPTPTPTPTPTPAPNPKPAPVCYGSKAHLQTGGDDFLWCEVVPPSGSTSITGERVDKVSGPSDAYVNGLTPSDVRWDGTPCPSGTKCYKSHMWAGQTTGDFVIRFTVSATFPGGTPNPTTGSTDVTVPIRQRVCFDPGC
jgi:hypothetical protein